MKIICFDIGNLSVRGTTTAIFDYAYYNEKILGNKSIISYSKSTLNLKLDENFSKLEEISRMFRETFDVIEYSNVKDLSKELDKMDCEYVYKIKAGFNDGDLVPKKKNLIHAVFNFNEPHGYRYAYVSEWLGNLHNSPYVPHIVELPKHKEDLREQLQIPKDKIVIGRYGGFEQFDIPFVKETIRFIEMNDDKFVFLFLNTKRFVAESFNIKFLDPIYKKEDKTKFINTCDAMIHARSDGESFGLSICEFLFHDKPVISCELVRDQNHSLLLNGHNMLYHNQYSLLERFFQLKYGFYNDTKPSEIVKKFSPELVMEQFDKVFLN